MFENKAFPFRMFLMLFGFASFALSLFATTSVHAGSFIQGIDNGTCINCHEDLYFLHDTGNWFCIRESPMPCVACHGGDPTATTQEKAHYDRSAHPVVNEDISKCQECHVGDCRERVELFDDVSKIKEVKLVSPLPFPAAPDSTIGLPATDRREAVNWPLLFDILLIATITSLALAVYFIQKMRHYKNQWRKQ